MFVNSSLHEAITFESHARQAFFLEFVVFIKHDLFDVRRLLVIQIKISCLDRWFDNVSFGLVSCASWTLGHTVLLLVFSHEEILPIARPEKVLLAGLVLGVSTSTFNVSHALR